MATIYRQVLVFTNKHAIIRGTISYGLLWPVGSLIQQTFIEGKNITNYDWMKCLRFSLYGGIITGPTMYLWMRFASILFPKRNLRSSMAKAITEQFIYDPPAICLFLYAMTLMEGKSTELAKHEVTHKYWDTYKVGFVYWPIVQTFNFSMVPAKNQVICSGFFSMLWSSFLAYMKHLEIKAKEAKDKAEHKKVNN